MKQQIDGNDLIQVAKRENNPKRHYLYVNPLQGKHLPVSPSRSLALFASLAEEAAQRFAGERLLVVGFAETATAIGAALAYGAGNVDFYCSTTREALPGADYLFFSESHSHAREQRLVLDHLAEVLPQVDRVVFAEDEVTTGNTIAHLISVLQGAFPALPLGFGILSLLNSMEEARLQAWEAQGIPVGFLHRIPQAYRAEEIAGYAYPSLAGVAPVYSPAPLPVVEIGGRWEARVAGPSGDLRRRCDAFVAQTLSQLTLPAGASSILVLGTEECMFPGLLLGQALEEQDPRRVVRFHATTRSPIAISPDPAYPLHARDPRDSVYEAGRRTFLYNLAAYDQVLLVTDAEACTNQGLASIVGALERHGNQNISLIQWRAT